MHLAHNFAHSERLFHLPCCFFPLICRQCFQLNLSHFNFSINATTPGNASSEDRPFVLNQLIMSRESRMRATINQKLTEMGERDRLKELLRAKLTECGWKDQMKAHCKEVIKEKGLEHVTVEDLVVEITPKGRALVPDSVKKELLHRIRAFLAQHAT